MLENPNKNNTKTKKRVFDAIVMVFQIDKLRLIYDAMPCLITCVVLSSDISTKIWQYVARYRTSLKVGVRSTDDHPKMKLQTY
jgi:hypothetical protein